MEQLVNFIIRPPRADYNPKNDLLDQEFMLKGRWFMRKDLEIKNSRGYVLQCSHYVPLEVPEGKALPCVIYCHGNSGCRADASEAAIILLPSNISVFALDFSGSGLSEGEHVSLGWNEKDDLRAVVNHLRTDANVSCIGLWGRSMGAVTSLMYGAEDPSIAGMVLDSPFSNLVELMMELVDTYKYPLPKFTVKLAIQHMRKIIKRKANFDIMDLDAIQPAKCCFVPALLGHATDDDFIQPHHSDRIHDAYAGDKNIIKFDGDHNSPRPQFYFDSITIFFHNVLSPPKYVPDEHYLHTMHDYFDQDNWDTINDIEYRNHRLIEPAPGLTTSSTEDAISQLRSRRPMSRMEVPSDISCSENIHGPEENGGESDLGPTARPYADALPNGHTNSWPIPARTDGEYVEYSLDGLSDMPTTIEDEERMIMEAIIESLKDLKQQGQTQEDEQCSGSSSLFVPPASIPASNELSDAEGSSSAITNIKTSTEPALEMTESGETEPLISEKCACSKDISGDDKSSAGGSSSGQDTEMAAGTRATLVVQKNPTNPASNVMEGLAQRWGNLFRNSR
ncbi:uncharacterized protein LOC110114100 isoform X2 [Dendrobium catenatum]|uniref:uncharacterized protein LOC110114100 isoform X2 n=1 Tax=Dendrobium catenatum TaxID=906689 RepID=UPI0009F3ABFF|nr:uncharacterized protein LOC110114100 isoform X2 [Dendrobium catenatum]